MKNRKKTKKQLVNELRKIQEKKAILEKEKVKNHKIKSELNQCYKKAIEIMDEIAAVITSVVEARDPYLVGHQQRVSELATAIATEMKLSNDTIESIRIAAQVHDVGKINLPVNLMNSVDKLANDEIEHIKNHSKVSYYILKTVNFPSVIAEIVYQHHERIDGSGYPRKLTGNEILLEAKILGVADVIEAMSSLRPYRSAYSISESLEEISKNKGRLYEPKVVDTCLELFLEKRFKFNYQ